jgi:4'-phosphopantetheinyl transferase
LLSRLLLRGTLSLYTGCAPGDHELLLGSRGKPFLDETIPPGGLSFSLTHSHGLLGLAVTKGRELGLDIEAVRDKSDLLGLARHCFSPRELAALTALPPSEHVERFFALWTLKESYIKARGLGLSLPLDSFSFGLDPRTQPLGLTCEPTCEDDATRWRLWQLRLGDQHAAALFCDTARCPAHPAVQRSVCSPTISLKPWGAILCTASPCGSGVGTATICSNVRAQPWPSEKNARAFPALRACLQLPLWALWDRPTARGPWVNKTLG